MTCGQASKVLVLGTKVQKEREDYPRGNKEEEYYLGEHRERLDVWSDEKAKSRC